MIRQHTVVLARAVSYAPGRIAVIRCISPTPFLLAHVHTQIDETPSNLVVFKVRSNPEWGLDICPLRYLAQLRCSDRIYCSWIIGSPRRMIGYTKFDSPHRFFFVSCSILSSCFKKKHMQNLQKYRAIFFYSSNKRCLRLVFFYK